MKIQSNTDTDRLATVERVRRPKHNARIRLSERRPDKAFRRSGPVNHRRSAVVTLEA